MEKQPDLRPWYRRVPHAVTMLFSIIVLMTILTYLLPAGSFERQLIDGRERVVPGTYHAIAGNPLSIMDMFRAFPTGFKTASDIILIILASGIMFGTLEGTKTVENAVGTMTMAEWPEWLLKGDARPQSKRIAWSTRKIYSKEDPLLPSGLPGPVRLLSLEQ